MATRRNSTSQRTAWGRKLLPRAGFFGNTRTGTGGETARTVSPLPHVVPPASSSAESALGFVLRGALLIALAGLPGLA